MQLKSNCVGLMQWVSQNNSGAAGCNFNKLKRTLDGYAWLLLASKAS